MQLGFLRKVVWQSHTNVTSFLVQFEKIGRGLLGEGFWSEGESVVGRKTKIADYGQDYFMFFYDATKLPLSLKGFPQ